MRVGVVGANGFVGRHVASALEGDGMQVLRIVRSATRASVDPRASWQALDYADRQQWAAALAGLDAVVLTAGSAHLREASLDVERRHHEANVLLPAIVAQAAVATGVRRVINLSSAAVYGRISPSEGFEESSPLSPHDPYSRSKLEGEAAIASAVKDASTAASSIRAPMVYGPAAPGNFARLVSVMRRGWPIPLGACHARRSFVSVRNLADLIRVALRHSGSLPPILVATDPEPCAVSQFVRWIAANLPRPPMVVDVPTPLLHAACVVLGRGDDWIKLAAPFVIRSHSAQAVLGWTAPHRTADELSWSVVPQ